MLITTNFVNLQSKKQNKTISNPQGIMQSQSFEGLKGLLKDTFKKTEFNPLEEAIKYMEKGNKATYLEKAHNMYVKSSNILLDNWKNLDTNGHRQYINAMLAVASCDASISTSNALSTCNMLFENLKKLKCTYAKDIDTLSIIMQRVLGLGKLAAERDNLETAKDCYQYCKYLADYTKETTNKKIVIDGKDIKRILDERIKAINTIRNI